MILCTSDAGVSVLLESEPVCSTLMLFWYRTCGERAVFIYCFKRVITMRQFVRILDKLKYVFTHHRDPKLVLVAFCTAQTVRRVSHTRGIVFSTH